MADISDFYRGDTKVYKFTFQDANNTAINITGWELWLTLKTGEDDIDANAVMQIKHVVGANPNDDAVNGIAFLTATSTDTALSVDTYYYDFQRVIPGSPPDVKTLLFGKVKVLRDITQSTA